MEALAHFLEGCEVVFDDGAAEVGLLCGLLLAFIDGLKVDWQSLWANVALMMAIKLEKGPPRRHVHINLQGYGSTYLVHRTLEWI